MLTIRNDKRPANLAGLEGADVLWSVQVRDDPAQEDIIASEEGTRLSVSASLIRRDDVKGWATHG